MKKLLIALVLLGLAVPASAQIKVGTNGYYVSNKPYGKRIAVLYDDRDYQALSVSNRNSMVVSSQAGLGSLLPVLKEQGADIHYYSYSWMEGIQTQNSAMRWRELGSYYPVVIVYHQRARFGSGSLTHRKRYFRPESTSCHVIHYGGFGDNLQDETGVAADSMLGTCSDTFSPSGLGATRVIVSKTSPNDTLPGFAVPFHLRTAVLPTNVSQVVRLFSAVNNAGEGDSVAGAADTMMWGWRVRTTPSGTNHASYSAQPWMEYVSTIQGGAITTSGHVLMALVYRYTTLPPIVIGGPNWDDCGNWGMDPAFGSGRPPYFATQGAAYQWYIPRVTYMDSLVSEWQNRWGTQITFSGQADTIVKYVEGTATGVPAQRWMKRQPFVLHVHDNDSTGVFVNPFGHLADNADTTGGNTRARVVGFRRDPTNATNMLKYGIYNRIVTADSLVRAKGFKVIPWMDHAQNAYAPANFNGGSGATLLTQDSVMQAIGEAGKYWHRGYQDNQSVRNTLGSFDGSSQTTRIYGYPDERYYYRSVSDGKTKEVVSIGTTALTSSGLDAYTLAETRESAQVGLTELLGIRCSPIRTLVPAYQWGESSAPAQGARYFGLGRVRVLYNHPKYFSNQLLGYYPDPTLMRSAIFEPLETLGHLAGRPIHRWVYPHEVRQKKWLQ